MEYLANNRRHNRRHNQRLDFLAPRQGPLARVCLVNNSNPNKPQGVSIRHILIRSHLIISKSLVTHNSNNRSSNRVADCLEGRRQDFSEPRNRTNPPSKTHWEVVFLAKSPPRQALDSSGLPPLPQFLTRPGHCLGVAP